MSSMHVSSSNCASSLIMDWSSIFYPAPNLSSIPFSLKQIRRSSGVDGGYCGYSDVFGGDFRGKI